MNPEIGSEHGAEDTNYSLLAQLNDVSFSARTRIWIDGLIASWC